MSRRSVATLFVIGFCAGVVPADDTVKVVSFKLVPKGAEVVLVETGSPGPGEKKYDPKLTVNEFDKPITIPAVKLFDVYLTYKSGLPVRIESKWGSKVGLNEIKLAGSVGTVMVRGDDLPRAAKIVLTAVDDPGPSEKKHVPIQETSDYKQDLLVVPGFYAVWVVPANGARAVKVADKIRVQAGRSTVVPEE